MDDEMGRILRGEQSQEAGQPSPPSVLRRVSNAVKHGRSFSDRAASSTTKSPKPDSFDTSSPTITSPTSADGLESLRTSLKRAQNHIAELESEKMSLQDKLEGSIEIKAVNNELNAKRNTMAFLDTQREMVVRELEIMTEHLSTAKDNTKPLDLASLKTNILKDFAESLQKLKQSMTSEIEDLMHKRNELTDEIGNLIQMKDKGFQEYETLSTKNTQLVHHNNELLRSIQGVYQDNRVANGADKSANGLGIFHPSAKVETPGSAEMRNLNLVNTDPSLPNLLHDTEAEPATVLTAPQVVNIRKGGKPNKFNWRRGGEKITGTLTKGIKGAFVNNEKGGSTGNYSIGMPYNQTHQAVGGSDGGSMHSGTTKHSEVGAGLFAQKNGGITHLKNNSSSNLVVANDPSGDLYLMISYVIPVLIHFSPLRLRALRSMHLRKALGSQHRNSLHQRGRIPRHQSRRRVSQIRRRRSSQKRTDRLRKGFHLRHHRRRPRHPRRNLRAETVLPQTPHPTHHLRRLRLPPRSGTSQGTGRQQGEANRCSARRGGGFA
jgi:hypothetical protein